MLKKDGRKGEDETILETQFNDTDKTSRNIVRIPFIVRVFHKQPTYIQGLNHDSIFVFTNILLILI